MNKLKLYTIIGITFVTIAGIIGHFIYDWSGNNFLLGLIFPVNESAWEHMKLLYFPMLLYSVYMSNKIGEEYPCITSSLLLGTLLGTFGIPVLFYTYSGILGRNITFLDISTFLISVLFAFIVSYRLTLSCKAAPYTAILKGLVLLIGVCFLVFTYRPPAIGIFVNPTAKTASITWSNCEQNKNFQ